MYPIGAGECNAAAVPAGSDPQHGKVRTGRDFHNPNIAFASISRCTSEVPPKIVKARVSR